MCIYIYIHVYISLNAYFLLLLKSQLPVISLLKLLVLSTILSFLSTSSDHRRVKDLSTLILINCLEGFFRILNAHAPFLPASRNRWPKSNWRVWVVKLSSWPKANVSCSALLLHSNRDDTVSHMMIGTWGCTLGSYLQTSWVEEFCDQQMIFHSRHAKQDTKFAP